MRKCLLGEEPRAGQLLPARKSLSRGVEQFLSFTTCTVAIPVGGHALGEKTLSHHRSEASEAGARVQATLAGPMKRQGSSFSLAVVLFRVALKELCSQGGQAVSWGGQHLS